MSREHNFTPLFDTDDLAKFLKVPAKTIREWRHKGVGPKYVRMGKHVRYHSEDIMEWLDDATQQNAA